MQQFAIILLLFKLNSKFLFRITTQHTRRVSVVTRRDYYFFDLIFFLVMFWFNLRQIVIRSCCRRPLSYNNSNRSKSNVDKVKWTANELMQTAADINMKRSIVGGNNRIRNQSASSKFAKQIFDYFLVVDFEATCEYDKKMDIQVR